MINSKVTNSKVFRDIYTSILSSSIELQANDGHMPAGHNGPYRDPETPVRNTSHYLISFIRAWELTLDERFKAAANKCLELASWARVLSERLHFSLPHETRERSVQWAHGASMGD